MNAIFDVDPTLYTCYTNVLCLLGYHVNHCLTPCRRRDSTFQLAGGAEHYILTINSLEVAFDVIVDAETAFTDTTFADGIVDKADDLADVIVKGGEDYNIFKSNVSINPEGRYTV